MGDGLRHGHIALDVPPDWADRSTLLFVGPAPKAGPTVHTTRTAQPSLSVSFTRARDGDARSAARAILDDELAGLRAMSVGFVLAGIEDFQCALGEGVISRHSLELDGVKLTQLHAVAVRGPIAVRAVASAGATDFAAVEPVLRAALTSLRVAGGAAP